MRFRLRQIFVLTLIAALVFPLRTYWLHQQHVLLTVVVPICIASLTGVWLAMTRCEMKMVVMGTTLAGLLCSLLLNAEIQLGTESTEYIRDAQSSSRYSLFEFLLFSVVTTTVLCTIIGGSIGRVARWFHHWRLGVGSNGQLPRDSAR